MSGQGVPVTAPGKCSRIVYAGSKQHIVEHAWSLDRERGLRLLSTLIDEKARNRAGKENVCYVEANEVALSEKAREKADELMAGKRKAAERRGEQQHARVGVSGADSSVSCPVIAAISGDQPRRARSRTGVGGSSSTSLSGDPHEV